MPKYFQNYSNRRKIHPYPNPQGYYLPSFDIRQYINRRLVYYIID